MALTAEQKTQVRLAAAFLHQVDLGRIRERYRLLLLETPRLEDREGG